MMRHVFRFSLCIALLVPCCKRAQEWTVSTGIKRLDRESFILSGTWIGGEWGVLTVRRTGPDSLVGSAGKGDVEIRGRVFGARADFSARYAGGSTERGYIYRIPSSDSLLVAFQDTGGAWYKQFIMTCDPAGRSNGRNKASAR